jgi:hypothetical protein
MKTLFFLTVLSLFAVFGIFHFKLFNHNFMTIATIAMFCAISFAILAIMFGNGFIQSLILLLVIIVAFFYFSDWHFGQYLNRISEIMQDNIHELAVSLSEKTMTSNTTDGDCSVCITHGYDDDSCVVCNEGNTP